MSNTYTLYTNAPVLSGANGASNCTTWLAAGIGGDYVAAFYDGEMRSRIFDASVSLPTLTAAFSPPGVTAYTALGSITVAGLYLAYGTVGAGNGIAFSAQVFPFGLNETFQMGEVLFQLTYAAGSADAGSPSVFGTDPFVAFLITTSSTG
jgi:hypothetical protein